MSYPIMTGMQVCFGYQQRWETLPIINLPPDAITVKRKIRNDSITKVYVKTPHGVEEWILAPVGSLKTCTELKLIFKTGINKTD